MSYNQRRSFEKWYPTANGLIDSIVKLKRLVENTIDYWVNHAEPPNWNAIQEIVGASQKQAKYSIERFESLGLCSANLPVFHDPLVKIGDKRFNSVLQAMAWAANLWSGPGDELHQSIDGKDFGEVNFLPVFQRFFCNVIKLKLLVRAFPSGCRVEELELHEWTERTIEIDDRLCQAGVLSELHRISNQSELQNGKFDFRKWYDDAHELLYLLRQAGEWFRRSTRNTISVTDDPTSETEQQRFDALDGHVKAEGQIALYEANLIRIVQAKLREGVKELWPLLEPAYFDLRDFEAKDLGRFPCAWKALDELANRTQGWAVDVWSIANRDNRGLSSGEWCDWMDKASWLSNTVEALHARLTLEKSWLLKHTPLVISDSKVISPQVANRMKLEKLESVVIAADAAFSIAVDVVLLRAESDRFETLQRELKAKLSELNDVYEAIAMFTYKPTTFGQFQEAGSCAVDVAIRFAKTVHTAIECTKVASLGRFKVEPGDNQAFQTWAQALAVELKTTTLDLSGWTVAAIRRDSQLLRHAIRAEFEQALNQSPSPRVMSINNATPNEAATASKTSKRRSPKELNQAFVKAIREWHGFDEKSMTCSNLSPITNPALAEKMRISPGRSTSDRIENFFDGKYAVLCSDSETLAAKLATLGEIGINANLANALAETKAKLSKTVAKVRKSIADGTLDDDFLK